MRYLWIRKRLVILLNNLLSWCSKVLTTCIRYVVYKHVIRHKTYQTPLKKALLIGTEEQLERCIVLLQKDSLLKCSIIGLVTTQPLFKQKRNIQGFPVLGEMTDFSNIIARITQGKLALTDIILTSTELRGAELIAFLSVMEDNICVSRILESVTNFSFVLKSISIDDVLDRFPRQISLQNNIEAYHFIARRRVLVTGAGGSIGRELVRQIAFFEPAEIILLEQNEYALWKVGLEIAEHFPHMQQHKILADIQKRDILKRIFSKFRPHLIFHAAALKHVPFVEKNPCEGILTNTVGTRNVADCARDYGADALVFISTDKAVYPSNIMGASKRCAEMYIQALDQQARSGMKGVRCVSVRFGNVLGSAGSVVSLFQHQIAHGGPITVTHPDMTRYFMTIPEAVGLVLQAAQRGISLSSEKKEVRKDQSAEPLKAGSVFVLEMGKPVRVMDLARYMVRLSGLKPDRDIAIHITGIRGGEKLAEKLFYEDESLCRTDHDRLWIATSEVIPYDVINKSLYQLEQICYSGDEAELRVLLQQIIPKNSLQNVMV